MYKQHKKKKSKKPSFLNKEDVVVQRDLRIVKPSVPNYNILSTEEQDYYRTVFISNFKLMNNTHNVDVDLSSLPKDLIELHLLYENYVREIEITKTVNDYTVYMSTGVKILVFFGKQVSLDLTPVDKMTKKYLPTYQQYFYSIAAEKYNPTTRQPANPKKDLINTFCLCIGSVILGQIIQQKFGSLYSLAFEEIAEMVLDIPTVTIPEKKESVFQANIPPVPAAKQKRKFGIF